MSKEPRKEQEQADGGPDEATLLARRRLLKSGFMAPAVLASFMLSRDARAAPGSCTPVVCGPNCSPSINCAPNKKPK